MMSENPLQLLMNPKSIAVAGASNTPTKMGTIQSLSVLKDGYRGKFYPLHPKEKTILGITAYATPQDLPEVPDLALLIVPIKAVLSLLEDFGKIGTKRAIVVTAGFRETGDAGQDMENKLNEVARRYGIRFVGPNCLGVINSQICLNTTVYPFPPNPGLLGLASQSGTYVTQVLPALRKRGIRFSKAISLGNEANIDIADALEFLGEDEQTKAIILYIEGIRDGRRFIEIARKVTPHKPVLAQYVGGSVSGARAGMSHTGAMSGPDFLYDGVFKQAGVIRVGSVEDLYDHGWTLATQPLPRGRRVAVITNSGGPSSSISYTCDLVGLEVPRFSAGLQKEIRKYLQPHAASANPVDLTFHMGMEKLAVTIPEIIIKSGEVDALIMHGIMRSGFLREIYTHVSDYIKGVSFEEFLSLSEPVIKEVFELPRQHNIPLIISSFFGQEDSYTKGFQENNIPVFHSPEKTARALGALYRYKLIRERKPGKKISLPKISPLAVRILKQAKENGQKALDEYAAKKLLAAYGVPVTKEKLTKTLGEALAAASQIGYPVALKACHWEIMHKSGRGLIALQIESAAKLKAAFKDIQKAAGGKVSVLVQKMLAGNREFLAGMTRFAGFGACVVFGLGGVFTEIHHDVTIRMAPLTAADTKEMFADLHARKLLDEFRGMPQVEKDKLSFVLQAVGNISLLHPEIAEIDLNPIIISGAKPVVADALIILEG
jgi:acyl-CoA synthetase (NDP forming)